MKLVICDACQTEIKDERDMKELQMWSHDGEEVKPFMPNMEICVDCALKIKEFVNKLGAIGQVI